MNGYTIANSSQTQVNPAFTFGVFAVDIIVIVLYIVTLWKIFVKAGKPGWAAIIPIYNLYVFLKIINRPGWWLILYLIPFVNIIISLITAIDLAKAFGKSSVFGVVMLWLLSFIGYPVLAFGGSQYHQSTSTPQSPSTPPQPLVQSVPPQPQQPMQPVQPPQSVVASPPPPPPAPSSPPQSPPQSNV